MRVAIANEWIAHGSDLSSVMDNNKNIQYSQRWGTQPRTTTPGGGKGGAAPGILTWYRRWPFGVTAMASHGVQDQQNVL